MTGSWTPEQLQHAIHEEVAAVVYAETHERPRRPAVDEQPAARERTPEAGQSAVPTILVGLDHSPASDTAVAWAAAEAVRRSGRLVLVRVQWVGDLAVSTEAWEEEERGWAALAASVRDAHPRLEDVSSELLAGPAGPVLVQRAAGADLLVLGTHGKGALSRAVLGSVSAYCAVHACVPTVIVPQDWTSARRPLTG